MVSVWFIRSGLVMRSMFVLFMLFIAAPASVWAESRVTHDSLTNFDSIRLDGSDRIVLRVGPEFSVVTAGEQADLNLLTMAVANRTLKVGRRSKHTSSFRPVTVEVTMPQIKSVEVTGSGTVNIMDADGDIINLAVSGSGSIIAAGNARFLDVSVSGSGTIDSLAMQADRLNVSNAGSGAIEAAASGAVTISSPGSGTVRVSGTRQCSVSGRGTGTVHCGPT